MTGRPHTLTPHGILGPPIDVQPPRGIEDMQPRAAGSVVDTTGSVAPARAIAADTARSGAAARAPFVVDDLQALQDALVETILAVHRPVPSRPEAHRFAPHDLQALQDALVGAPFTLAELAAAIVRSPKSLASVVKTAGAR